MRSESPGIKDMLNAGQITAGPGLDVVVQKFESSPGVWDAEIYATIPEPGTIGLISIGGALLVIRRRLTI